MFVRYYLHGWVDEEEELKLVFDLVEWCSDCIPDPEVERKKRDAFKPIGDEIYGKKIEQEIEEIEDPDMEE